MRYGAKGGGKTGGQGNTALFPFQGPGVDDERVSLRSLKARLDKCARDNGVYIGAGVGVNFPFTPTIGVSDFTLTVCVARVCLRAT